MRSERFNVFSHTAGAAICLAASILSVFMTLKIDRGLSIAVAISGISQSFLFAASTLYHLNKTESNGDNIWHRLDYSAIFIIIAGTYTAPMYIYSPASMFKLVITSVWILAAVGFIIKMRHVQTKNWINFVVYAPLVLFSFYPITALWNIIGTIPSSILHVTMLKTLLLGGITITGIGGIIYAWKKPDPLPGRIGFHGLFHLLVLIGVLFFIAALVISIPAYHEIRKSIYQLL